MTTDRPSKGDAAPVEPVRPPAPRPVFPVRVTLPLAYATLFVALGLYMPYFPLWLQERGLGPQEISIALAVPLVTRLLASPVLGLLSDRIGRPKAMLSALAFGSALAMGALAFAGTPLAIYLALGVLAMAWNPSFSLIDAYATRQARAGHVDYGRSRLWGSGAFVLANLGGGVIVAQTGAVWVVGLMIAGQCAYLAATALLPELPRAFPASSGVHATRRLPAALLVGTAAAALIQASHATLYAFASVHWRGEGISLSTIGVLWAIGVIAEMALFRFGTRLTRRFGPAPLIAAGGAAAVLRFAALAFDPPFALLVPLQVLHGLTFGATYLGLVELVARSVSEARAGSGQSIAGWTVSLALSAASAVSGPLWAAFGARAFLLSAALGLFGLLLALVCARFQPHTSGVGGKTVAPS